MPSINRIRVNNVKYNFGTQGYDDFSMRMYGRNTLYDLANGGGKSVLMLLLMQNLIPNCTLDDKQPIEKLFRDNSNTVIHSLIEWKLDETDIKDGLRYMTTGFCAKKASGSDEEREDATAQIEYFNYVLFYRDYNKNDIVNLPLERDKEHISYKALKNYLHDLSRNDKNMLVYVFDRKGEYQKFIAEYGLFESHWEIIRGINKTEGHVRTYFESNYKTTRRVIEDLLIEEIIEKAYITKTSRETGKTESTAKLLLTIQEELKTLSEKKKDIRVYDYEKELLSLLRERIDSFMDLYQKKDELSKDFGRIYITLEGEKKGREERLLEMRESLDKSEAEVSQGEVRLELLKLLRDIYEKEALEETLNKKKAEEAEIRSGAELQDALLREKMAIREFIILRDAENELKKLDASRDGVKRDEDIYSVVANIRSIIFGDIEKNGAEIEKLNGALGQLEKEYSLKDKERSEAFTETAVLDNRLEYINADLKGLDERYNTLQESLSRPVIGNAVSIISTLHSEIAGLEDDIKDKEEEIKGLSGNLLNAEKSLDSLAIEREKASIREKELSELLTDYDTLKEKKKAVSLIYTQNPDSKLYDIEDSLIERNASLIVKLHEMKKRLSQFEKRENDIRNGRLMAPTKGVEKLQEYITTRHGASAMFGMDYVASLPEDMKKELLTRLPGIAYGLVVDDLELLMQDPGLSELDIDEELILYDKESLSEARLGTEEGIGYVRHDKNFYLDLSSRQSRLNILGDEMSLLSEDIRSSESMLDTLKEDMDFIHLYIDKGYDSLEEDMAEIKDILKTLDADIQKNEKDKELYSSKLAASKKALEEFGAEIEIRLKDISILNEIAGADDDIARLKKEKVEISEKKKRLEGTLKSSEDKLNELGINRMELQDKKRSLEEVSASLNARWENRYAMYYVEGTTFGKIPGDLNDLEILFDKSLGEVSEGRESLEKEKLLRDTLTGTIERQKRSISELGIELSDLYEQDENGSLLGAGDELIEEIRRNLKMLQDKSISIDKNVRECEASLSRIAGSIDYARRRFAERFGEESIGLLDDVRKEVDSQSEKDIAEHIKEASVILSHKKEERDSLKSRLTEYLSEEKGNEDILRLSERIIEADKVDVSDLEVLEDTKKIRESFDQMLLSHDKLLKDIERAKADMMKVKLKVYDSLAGMNRNELAASVRDDVYSPETLEEARSLTDKLRDVIDIITLEKDRLEKSLVGMQQLKDNFIEECIERCLDVRSELDKLTKLSEITMGSDKIQMIRLTIPYVKDEFIKERMSEYIDQIVAEMDNRETDNEMQKFLNASLSMKKLFSVIVTDMSKIKLMLYKRERIKEQSRYLRYEEAVGSTGQSQGIYIQFLISIINYIAGMYSTADNEKRSKTLFIDNPFGAAKDIYIWEPIFGLLEENNCQLIVPARGATPEITGRFDINYVLGQQMTGKRTTTVVTSFTSRTKGEELEYKELDYEQQSFDFI